MAVDRNYILDKMKGRVMNQQEFDFDRLSAPPLYSFLSVDDIAQLHKLATSIRYQAKPVERLKAIDDILRSRGFVKFAGGTNRVVYRFIENDSILLKVASDAVGINDNPREFANQMIFKPFVSKTFEVSECGTVALVERVIPITSREEFYSVADDIFDLISKWFLGEYVMDDIGSNYFLNYGLRPGFGPVLLDYTFSYKLDGNKLYCNTIMPDGSLCGGVIDYDDGFNHLYCTKCGRKYKAIELKKAVDEGQVIRKGGQSRMKVRCSYGENKESGVIKDSEVYMDTRPKFVPKRRGKKAVVGSMKVEVRRGSNTINQTQPKEEEKIAVEERYTGTLNARGTVGYAKHTEPVMETVEPEDIVTAEEYDEAVKEAEVETQEEEALWYTYGAKIINTEELTDDEDKRFKCCMLVDDTGTPLRIGSEDGPYILVDSISNIPVDSLSIVDKGAYEKLVTAYGEAKEKTSALMDKNKEMANTISVLNKEIEDLKSRLDTEQGQNVVTMSEELQALSDENNDLQNEVNHLRSNIKIMEADLPYHLDSAGRKRKKGSGAFYGNGSKKNNVQLHETTEESEAGEQTESNSGQFKVKSPLLEDADETESIPVGAAPPTTKTKSKKTKK